MLFPSFSHGVGMIVPPFSERNVVRNAPPQPRTRRCLKTVERLDFWHEKHLKLDGSSYSKSFLAQKSSKIHGRHHLGLNFGRPHGAAVVTREQKASLYLCRIKRRKNELFLLGSRSNILNTWYFWFKYLTCQQKKSFNWVHLILNLQNDIIRPEQKKHNTS